MNSFQLNKNAAQKRSKRVSPHAAILRHCMRAKSGQKVLSPTKRPKTSVYRLK